MPKFRKKPVTITADNYDGSSAAREYFFHRYPGKVQVKGRDLLITTLEGTMKAAPGDWIIKGVKGEVYPCKPDIFKETYEIDHGFVIQEEDLLFSMGEMNLVSKNITIDRSLRKYPKLRQAIIDHELKHQKDSILSAILRDIVDNGIISSRKDYREYLRYKERRLSKYRHAYSLYLILSILSWPFTLAVWVGALIGKAVKDD